MRCGVVDSETENKVDTCVDAVWHKARIERRLWGNGAMAFV